MSETNLTQDREDDEVAFNRRFKYAIHAYAVIEFVAFLLLFYYKYYRRDI